MLSTLATLASFAVVAAEFRGELFYKNDNIDFAQDSFEIEYRLTNLGPSAEFILPWHTPLDGLWEDLFEIKEVTSGAVIPYTGKHPRRLPTTKEDYMEVPVKEASKIVTVDMTYSYDIPRDGLYSITLRQGDAEGFPLYDNSTRVLSIRIINSLKQNERWSSVPKMGTNYGSCTSAQIGDVNYGYNIAVSSQVPGAQKCIGNVESQVCSEYPVWFGAQNSARYSSVKSLWQNIGRDLPSANYDCCVGCGAMCGRNLYAYVYPADPTMTIYLCSVYFDRKDERAETLTHEQSHFRVTGGTDDYTYGESNCRALAQSNPDRAVNNADNHCYFGRYCGL